MTWNEYKDANQIKGRSSKKSREEHERSIFVAWQNLYRIPQERIIKEITKILTKSY